MALSFHCLCLCLCDCLLKVQRLKSLSSAERGRAHVSEHIQSSVWKKPIVWIRVTNSLELENVFNPSIKSRRRAPTYFSEERKQIVGENENNMEMFSGPFRHYWSV